MLHFYLPVLPPPRIDLKRKGCLHTRVRIPAKLSALHPHQLHHLVQTYKQEYFFFILDMTFADLLFMGTYKDLSQEDDIAPSIGLRNTRTSI